MRRAHYCPTLQLGEVRGREREKNKECMEESVSWHNEVVGAGGDSGKRILGGGVIRKKMVRGM